MRHSVVVAVVTTLFLVTPLSTRPQALVGRAQDAVPQRASISGVVVRAGAGEPVPRAQVSLIRSRGGAPQLEQNPFALPTVTTDERGRFEFKDVDADSYRLIAARNGFTKQEYGQRSMNRPGTVLNVDVGQHIQGLTFRLSPAATLSGRVVDETTGEPLPGITVQAMRSTYDATGKRTLKVAASERTNDLGEYRLYWINPGHYYISASAQRTGLDALSAVISQETLAPPPKNPAESQLASSFTSLFLKTMRSFLI